MTWVLLVVWFTHTGWQLEMQEFDSFGACKKGETFVLDNIKQDAKFINTKCIINRPKNERPDS